MIARVARDYEFRTDLYRGTAPFYDRYRPPYPRPLLNDICRRLPVSGSGRLLDLACGTGQIAFPLAERFAQVVAVDQEGESVAYASAKAQARGTTNIVWVTGAAETVDVDGAFELVAIGNAFHRLKRQVVARRASSWLRPGGGIALLWGANPLIGDHPWQRDLVALFSQWMAKAGTTDRVPAGWQEAMEEDPHEQVLRRAGLQYVGRFEFPVEQAWTVETLTGFAYSTSLLSQDALGPNRQSFEREIADTLVSHCADGTFCESSGYSYELARKRPDSIRA